MGLKRYWTLHSGMEESRLSELQMLVRGLAG